MGGKGERLNKGVGGKREGRAESARGNRMEDGEGVMEEDE